LPGRTSASASAFGIRVQPRVTGDETLSAQINLNSYQSNDMEKIIGAWLPLTFAMNSLNRAMGNHDLYPFVLSPTVIAKLSFVHSVVHRTESEQEGSPRGASVDSVQ